MNQSRNTDRFASRLRRSMMAAFAVVALTACGIVSADTYSMAPPTQDTTFNFADIPQSEQVPIERACFDRNGYQLFDTVGETIVVPFENNNLYVMKFGQSSTGQMYFVNDNGTPTLYVPDGGYLENAGVPGARWYPFSSTFRPSHPVFLGVAPSYSEFLVMGWYPGMRCYAGYYRPTAWYVGCVVYPALSFMIVIGDDHYYGWSHYHDYYYAHPAPYHVREYRHEVYNWGGRRWDDRDRRYDTGRHDDGDHHFRGTPYNGHDEHFGRPTGGHDDGRRPDVHSTDTHGTRPTSIHDERGGPTWSNRGGDTHSTDTRGGSTWGNRGGDTRTGDTHPADTHSTDTRGGSTWGNRGADTRTGDTHPADTHSTDTRGGSTWGNRGADTRTGDTHPADTRGGSTWGNRGADTRTGDTHPADTRGGATSTPRGGDTRGANAATSHGSDSRGSADSHSNDSRGSRNSDNRNGDNNGNR